MLINAKFAVPVILFICFFSIDLSAHPSWGIAVDRQGQVYFSDLKSVWKIDLQGKLSLIRTKADTHVHDLNVDENGNLFGADNSYTPETKKFLSAIWKMSPNGDFSYIYEPTENPPNGTSIWKDSNGNSFHFAGYPKDKLLVLKRTSEGNVSALVGTDKASREYKQGVPYGGGMTIGKSDEVYFTDSKKIYKLTANGELSTLAAISSVNSADRKKKKIDVMLIGLTIDEAQNVYAADFSGRRVLKIAQNGSFSTILTTKESWSPSGVTFKNNELYILEFESGTDKARVRKLSSDGKVKILTSNQSSKIKAVDQQQIKSEEKSVNVELTASNSYLIAAGFTSIVAIGLISLQINKNRPRTKIKAKK